MLGLPTIAALPACITSHATLYSMLSSIRNMSLAAGAWFPLVVAAGVFTVSYLWKWGTSRRLAHSSEHGVQLDDVIQEHDTSDGSVRCWSTAMPLKLVCCPNRRALSAARPADAQMATQPPANHSKACTTGTRPTVCHQGASLHYADAVALLTTS